MNFEDIVDMEWVDSHTTTEEYSFGHQNGFLLDTSITPTQIIGPEIKMEPITSIPTTEQIKQLIEIAKKQLALREQLQQLQQQSIQISHQPLFHALTNTQVEVQTAAPSTIFAPPPPIPPPSSSTTTTTAANMTTNTNTTITTTPNSNSDSNLTTTTSVTSPSFITSTDMTLTPIKLETISEETAINKEKKINNNNNNRKESFASMSEESISLEAYAEADGIDLKKLTPKERRQLRNKISARNFRVRRKEYISTLEGQVNEHKIQAEALKEKLTKVEDENKKLRKEMDYLKKQNQILQQQLQQQQSIEQQQSKNPVSSTSSSSSPRISSPLPKPNLNKDISILGTKATESYRQQDNCILVSNAVMPVWDYNAILNKPLVPDYIQQIVAQFLLSMIQLTTKTTMSCETTCIQQENEYKLPLMPDERDFGSPKEKKSSPDMEDLYDVLIESSLINSNSVSDKLFLWWDNKTM
ncbi:uncharacterized protein BX663DRAFT_519821 [Cokeromyces recurvatus]|uniref:uncharacterized protein n=1 Tax=Cokeromyces recurvatus TaxID=90255 RepID=UPI0022201FCD|nr:uncharacterized protein BX663DRAFT_519821 [Cokeromyces recurvatus]KAI7899886.1 hypothetical protein BX663DRAFT_519821 [Cokeromyces recurvatus]